MNQYYHHINQISISTPTINYFDFLTNLFSSNIDDTDNMEEDDEMDIENIDCSMTD